MSEPEELPELSNIEKEVYSWQTTVEGFGEKGQRKLMNATVMISRIGGLGGLVAYELAAAGVGRLILAHGGLSCGILTAMHGSRLCQGLFLQQIGADREVLPLAVQIGEFEVDQFDAFVLDLAQDVLGGFRHKKGLLD